jgi:predicted ATPase
MKLVGSPNFLMFGDEMLLRFGIKNFLSFDNYQELSFMATKLRDDTRVDVVIRERAKLKVLPAVVIYGANASGKSNLLAGIRFMRYFVKGSHAENTEALGIKRQFFRLGVGREAEPSQLDCDFIMNDIRYHYGFEFDHQRIIKEWLYSFPDGRRNILYIRETGKPVYFGPNFSEKGKGRLVEPIMRENSLFLSAATQNNLGLASEISGWFKTSILVEDSNINNLNPKDLSKYLDDEIIRQRIVNFVKSADPTISGIEVVEQEIPVESAQFLGEFRAFMMKHIPEAGFAFDKPETVSKEYRLTHLGQDGGVSFPNNLESRGTIKLLQILGPILQCLTSGRLLVCDELESSLHVILAAELVKMFNASSTNPYGAQILVATHDTNLLDIRCLRRDQIWFTEKSPTGATHIYSLSELSVRKADSLKRGYLQGRFGAIPYLPSSDLVCETA